MYILCPQCRKQNWNLSRSGGHLTIHRIAKNKKKKQQWTPLFNSSKFFRRPRQEPPMRFSWRKEKTEKVFRKKKRERKKKEK